MDNKALIDSFSEFKESKQIDKIELMGILEEVFRNAIKRKYGTDENFDFVINPDKGDMEIWRNRTVVDDGEVEDSSMEISLSEARKIEPDFEIGEEVSQEFSMVELGRRAILALGQNLRAKILELDNNALYKEFEGLVGELYTAEVHHIRPKVVILKDDNDNDIILPKDKQIPSDYFKKGEVVRGIIESVEFKGAKPQIVMSRTSEDFLKRLFEQEIPEIADDIIMIRRAARIPGEKAKVAVDSYNDNIDAVGACVGVRGSRIHGVVRELGNENIDVLHYTSNPVLFISRALSPAKVKEVKINEEKMSAEVYLDAEEVSKAIGKNGFNIKLASMLTGYTIDVMRDGIQEVEDDVELTEFSDEIEDWVIEEFSRIGLDTAKRVLRHSVEDLVLRTDLEQETIEEVLSVLRAEFEE